MLYELAKCVSVCENDLNASLVDELNKHGILQPSLISPSKTQSESTFNVTDDFNQSVCSSVDDRPMRLSLIPNVSGILSLIDDPSLLSFVNDKDEMDDILCSSFSKFDLNECLEKLKIEADSLLKLSEKMIYKRLLDNREIDEAQKSLEEEDGLKMVKDDYNIDNSVQRRPMSHSDLNDLKNRLLIAETKNQELEKKLTQSLAQQDELTQRLNSYLDSHSEELSEG